jgi:PAS domain S-box-containing protein
VHSRLTSEYPDPVTSQGIEQGLRQVDGEALYANYDGEPVIGVYRWFDETGSALLAEMSQEEAFAPARQLALVIGLIGLAVVAVLGLGIYGISRRIARPILAITDTATAVSAGDLTREAPVTTNDEVGTLAVAFNEMTSQLRENVETLEQRVDERTAELSTALEAQREAEAEIRRQKQYFEELVEISPAAVVTMGIDERVTGWNPAATRLFGYTPEEALGRTVDELVLGSESQLEEGNAVAREAVESGQASRITQRTRKDGSLVDVEILVVPLVIDGERVGSYAIYHDIGELQEARQQADAANQAKGAFLAAMSHEIRTPMNAIIGMGGLLMETELSDEQRDYASTIATSGESLLAIINDILDFSKIEAGKMDLEFAPFDVRACVESVIELIGAVASAKGLEVAYEIAPGTPETAVGDASRLRQILLNLLNNAVKFTESGEVVVSVRSELTGDGHRYHVAVRDTGIGVPADRVDRLFRSFSQADVSTSRRFGGTGLGLAISRRLAELMGGTMWVESTGVPGEGSTFHVTFVAGATDMTPTALRPDPALRGRRALVVDDNATNRRLMSGMLASWDVASAACGSASEALKLLSDDPFDLAVIDMVMPELDGLDLAVRIRAAVPDVPLVLASSVGRHEVTADPRWDAAGIAALLTKPIRASTLHEAVVAALGITVHDREEAEVPMTLDPSFASTHPLRILLAEDNVVNQKLALRMLEKLGYRADVVGNGVETIEALERQPYDLLLTDVQMPEMDGLEATRRIVTRWSAAERPWIVGVTAEAMQGDRERCLEAGMDDYVTKPIRAEELVAAITRVPRGVRDDVGTAADAEAPGNGVIDETAFRRFLDSVGGDEDPGFVADLIAQFLRDAPGLVTAIREGQAAGDADGVRRAAHTLKSNAATFGATDLAERSRRLEHAAADGDLDEGASQADAIEEALDVARIALSALADGDA